jgi:catechol 2,3-dioxygenase-like lactoylglutathione lyase family enzyme
MHATDSSQRIPNMTSVVGTLHTGFTVADVRRLAAFFRDCLGFEVTEPRSPPSETLSRIIGVEAAAADVVYVNAPGHVIELLQYYSPVSGTANAPRPCDIGFAHLSFLVENVASVADAAARFGFVAETAMPTIQHGPHAGRRATYLRDSHGFSIELMGE